ncbi:hypothetical protein V8B97DRAFT_1992299 [Scleroderma yunnanense]
MLNVRNSQIENPRAVAEYLKAIVPGLRTSNVESGIDTLRVWRVVQDLMKGT